MQQPPCQRERSASLWQQSSGGSCPRLCGSRAEHCTEARAWCSIIGCPSLQPRGLLLCRSASNLGQLLLDLNILPFHARIAAKIAGLTLYVPCQGLVLEHSDLMQTSKITMGAKMTLRLVGSFTRRARTRLSSCCGGAGSCEEQSRWSYACLHF